VLHWMRRWQYYV